MPIVHETASEIEIVTDVADAIRLKLLKLSTGDLVLCLGSETKISTLLSADEADRIKAWLLAN